MPTWATLSQLGSIWDQFSPACAGMVQRGPIWGQFETNMVLQIIEKPLFFLGFCNILRTSLKAFGNALENLLGRLEKPLGIFWVAGRIFEDALGSLGDALGSLREALGAPWGHLGKPPWQNLGRTFWRELPESTWARGALAELSFRCTPPYSPPLVVSLKPF